MRKDIHFLVIEDHYHDQIIKCPVLPLFITYDNLNRLATYNFNATGANTLSGVYNYSMDEFGNLLEQVKQSGSGEAPQGHANPVDRNTNRLNNVNYDLLGNQTQTSVPGGTANLTYLDQGHVYDLKSADGTTLLYRYYYDAEGKRRAKAKAVGGAVSLADNCSFFFYSGEDLICQKDLGAEVVPESDSPEKVNGAYYQPKFLLTDHLGTTRAELMFDPATLQPKLAKTYDTMPYGELISFPTGRAEPVLFTDKPRDNESGLDYFGARYYSNALGRFTSVDPGPHLWDDPQTLNRFAYTRNNPIRHIDLQGEYWVVAPEMREQVKRYISVALRDPVTMAQMRLIANDPKRCLVQQRDLRNPNGQPGAQFTNGTAMAQPGSLDANGQRLNAGTIITLSKYNISDTARLSSSGPRRPVTPFSVGLEAFYHEVAHTIAEFSQIKFFMAQQAGNAGDLPRPQLGPAQRTAHSEMVNQFGDPSYKNALYTPNPSTDAEAEKMLNEGALIEIQNTIKSLNASFSFTFNPPKSSPNPRPIPGGR